MNTAALLAGLIVVPLIMLYTCHRFRRRTYRQRRMLWGGFAGYCLSVIVVLLALLWPPVIWTDDQPVRGFLVFWSLALFPAIGAVSAAFSVASGNTAK
ncbi:MAG: hypothetical protein V2I24_14005 [Halieaceae bacterium]|jgi:hypothetical protein|nr:hypothetical protein [Halieaceae bacterium]